MTAFFDGRWRKYGGIADPQLAADLLGGEVMQAMQTNNLERDVRDLLFPQHPGCRPSGHRPAGGNACPADSIR